MCVRSWRPAILVGILCTGLTLAPAQSPHPATTSPNTQAASTASSTAPAAAKTPVPSAPAAQPKTYTVPAGTKVLLELRSAIDTRSAKPGDGVYLVSTFPVVVGSRVLIPAGVYVQGVIDRVARAGRIRGRAQLDMYFTSMIFPNGSVVEIPGMVNSLPGAKNQTVKNDGEGTIEEAGNKGRHAGTVAKIGVPTAGTIGAVTGAESGHPLAGGIAGVGVGLAAAGLATLFTRGADVDIPKGTQVEMLLQRSLILQQSNLSGNKGAGAAPDLVPSPNQPKPMKKPRRIHILCPVGGLGCP